MKLTGKVAVITGAGSGIGRESAAVFAERGATVVAADIDEEAARETISQLDGRGEAVQVDVSDEDDVEALIAATVEEFGSVDVLFNNAGIPHKPTPVENMEEHTWDDVMSINLKGAFLCSKHAVPELRDGGGIILNMASTAGIRPRSGHFAYSVTKGGMIIMTKALATELAGDSIRVNALCPVATDTQFLRNATDENLSVDEIKETIPLGRLADPVDIAYTAAFLASDEAEMLTGQAIGVDGGFLL